MVSDHRRALLRGAVALLLAMQGPAHANDACCGQETPNGQRLRRFLDATHVETLWLPGYQVDWQTGERTSTVPGGPESHTHCSAFAAAVAMRLGIYLLRPPEHKQNLLANAQMAWLDGAGGQSNGWRKLATTTDAQFAANRGELVVASFRSPDPHKPGHIAIVRPSEISLARLEKDGPEVTQAGSHNAIETPLARGFRDHAGAWAPDGSGKVQFFAHPIDWSKVKESP